MGFRDFEIRDGKTRLCFPAGPKRFAWPRSVVEMESFVAPTSGFKSRCHRLDETESPPANRSKLFFA
jgi:hypothetical protein